MIWRRSIPPIHATRLRQRFAWLPTGFRYKDETIVVWLSKYVVEEKWHSYFTANCNCVSQRFGSGWRCERKLTVTDACLEKLNAAQVPAQPQAQPSPNTVGNALSGNQALVHLGQVFPQHRAQLKSLGLTP